MDFEFQEVAAIEEVPEQFRGLYKENNGKYALDEKYKGVSDAVVGLNKSLKAARQEAKTYKTKSDLTPLAEYGEDPASIAQTISQKLKEAQEAAKAGGNINIEKIKEDIAKQHSAEINKYKTSSEALRNQLQTLLVDNEATQAIAELKGVPELLLPFVRQHVRVVEENGKFQPIVVDEQGDRRYSSLSGQPLTIKELVASMKSNERYARLFDSEQQKGGGGAPSGKKTPAAAAQGELTPTQKIQAGLAKNQAVPRNQAR